MPTVEQALVARAGPYVLSARAKELLEREASVGCTPDLAPCPVQLEPPFRDLIALRGSRLLSANDPSPLWLPEEERDRDLRRYQVWVQTDSVLDWTRAELFLRQLHPLSHRVGLEFAGNAAHLALCLVVHQEDVPVLWAAFRAWQPSCELSAVPGPPRCAWQPQDDAHLLLRDYYPPPPYSHLFTCPEELRLSPLEAVLAALMEIRPPSVGLYQVLLKPVSPDHNWHRNVELLLDLEYAVKLLAGSQLVPTYSHYPQQSPSGDLHHMAQDTQSKAHNDKPFYSVAVRVAVAGNREELPAYMDALASPLALFQHGGASLCFLTERDYSRPLSTAELGTMLDRALTYRPGFLLNSEELSGLVHLLPGSALSEREAPMELLETLTVQDDSLLSGTPIGICSLAGVEQTVCIPTSIRPRSTHLIARHGMGKSTLLEHMILHDLDRGHGVAVLDPHGDLIQRLLCLIPEEHVERTIYFDPGDPDWVPLWNPLSLSPGQDVSRTADDLVAGIKSVVLGWGDRLEHLLRHGFFALLHMPDSTFLDMSELLRRKSEESQRLQRVIVESLDNVTARSFWKHDFNRYENAALSPPKHKLSKLLLSGTTSLMLSQPENRIDLRAIMDSQQAFLVDLHGLGSETRQILGSFLLSLLHTVALGRSALPRHLRRPFHIYCDEAHRFVTKHLEDLLVETRKFGVDLTLAHQFLRQFHASERDALASVGTTILFNVDARDARVLLKDLRGKISVDDLIVLEVGEAVARIGTQVVRLKAFPPLEIPSKNHRDEILERSHRHFCRPAQEVKEMLRNRSRRWEQPFTPLTEAAADPSRYEEFEYDEFE